jgi:hypothetical protein
MLLAKPGSDDERIDGVYERALGRPAKAKEREALRRFLAGQRAHYRANLEEARKLLRVGLRPAAADLDPAEYAAWATVCRVVLNLHETITRY